MKNITIFPGKKLPDPKDFYACITCGGQKFTLKNTGDCVCAACGEISETARCYASEVRFDGGAA